MSDNKSSFPCYNLTFASTAFSPAGSSNSVLVNNGFNNTLQLVAADGSFQFSRAPYEVCLRKLYIPYSFPNFVTASTLSYVWPSNGLTYTITIPAKQNYTISELNYLLQYTFLNNGHYLVDPSNNPYYFCAIVVNPVSYKIDLQMPLVPTALPAGGWSNPAGMTFPAVASNVQLILAEPQLLSILGFNAGTYPTTPTITGGNYLVWGQQTPILNPYSAILIWLNCCNNTTFTNATQIDSFSINSTAYGYTIAYEPRQYTYVKVDRTDRNQLFLSLKTQNGVDLTVLDLNWSADVHFRPIV